MKSRYKSGPCRTTCSLEPCEVLGPYPATSVAALADLGLTDQEIARYFRVQPDRITRLLRHVPELRHVCGSNAVTILDLDGK